MADTTELEAKVAALEKELAAIRESQKAPETKPEPAAVEYEKALSELKAQMKELTETTAARIKALESEGQSQTSAGAGRELADPINSDLVIDRKTGTIRRG